jgi:hypothetical protein
VPFGANHHKPRRDVFLTLTRHDFKGISLAFLVCKREIALLVALDLLQAETKFWVCVQGVIDKYS